MHVTISRSQFVHCLLYLLLVMQESLAPEIISHFVMHGTSVAEIVKHLITVLKKKDDDISNIFLEALKRVWHEHLSGLIT